MSIEPRSARRSRSRAGSLRQHGWPVIDVTRRSIEETAAAIIDLCNASSRQIGSVGESFMTKSARPWQVTRRCCSPQRAPRAGAARRRPGLPSRSLASDIDEREVEAPLRGQGRDCGRRRRASRARQGAGRRELAHAGRLVLGADQTLLRWATRFSPSRDDRRRRGAASRLSGRIHALHSALCLTRDETVLFATVDVRPAHLPAAAARTFIDRYLAAAGDAVLGSVGAYQLEGLGIHLFDKIEGDHATILGLPLLPLLAFLRQEGLSRRMSPHLPAPSSSAGRSRIRARR